MAMVAEVPRLARGKIEPLAVPSLLTARRAPGTEGAHGRFCRAEQTPEEIVPFAMSHPKLHQVAASSALREWARSCPESTFSGMCRVETRHATYLFQNSSCFAVSGRGHRGGTTSTDLVGMKIVGWLLSNDDPGLDDDTRQRLAEGGIRVSRNWHPRARAVLYGKASLLGGMRLALTSPVETFTLYGDGTGEPMRPPAFDRSPTGSQTRVGVAVPAGG
jgi:hypothetical protein